MSIFKRIAASSLHVSKDIYWLESRFHFSFAGYYDPNRMNFGTLRVVNDDLVKPNEGFDTHPHSNMEIISYVIQGGLTHKDSMGTKETLTRGCVQYMSAGTGITHSEYNDSRSEMLRFLQIWIVPDRKGHTPRYGSKRFTEADRLNKIQHLVGNEKEFKDGSIIPIHQDANIYVSELEPGNSVNFTLGPSRQLYAVCIEGNLSFTTENNGSENLGMRDGLEVRNRQSQAVDLRIANTSATGKSHFLFIEGALA